MAYYVRNKQKSVVILLDGALRLEPKGEKGDIKPLSHRARHRKDVLDMEGRKRIEVLTSEQYVKDFLTSKSAPPAKTPATPAPAEEVKSEESEELATTAVAEEDFTEKEDSAEEVEDAEEQAEEDSEEEVEDSEELLSVEDFSELSLSKKRKYIRKLGLVDSINMKSHGSMVEGYSSEMG